MYTTDHEYTNMRLQHTIVRSKILGTLVRVLFIGGGDGEFLATVCRVGEEEDGNNYVCKLDELDLSSPPLGNVDWNGRTYYATRVPRRNDWRQGLRKDNLGYVYEGKLHNYNLPSMTVLNLPVYDKYKPYKKGRAFSRDFSVDEEGRLWYKCREIVGRDMAGEPVLKKKFEWLKEALEDALER